MMFLKVSVFMLLVGVCLAQIRVEGRQTAPVSIDCSDATAVANAVSSNQNFRCGTQATRGTFKKCPQGEIFNSEVGACVKNPNARP